MYICIGLALITKAEFDAALADFNSRLTTFEAGINSKIDSQVTSYLDRNGIWNGKKQDISIDATRGIIFGIRANTFVSTSKYIMEPALLTTDSDASLSTDTLDFFKSNKSGLVFVQIKIRDITGSALFSTTSRDANNLHWWPWWWVGVVGNSVFIPLDDPSPSDIKNQSNLVTLKSGTTYSGTGMAGHNYLAIEKYSGTASTVLAGIEGQSYTGTMCFDMTKDKSSDFGYSAADVSCRVMNIYFFVAQDDNIRFKNESFHYMSVASYGDKLYATSASAAELSVVQVVDCLVY